MKKFRYFPRWFSSNFLYTGSFMLRHPTEQKLAGFADLEKGWHYGEGEAFSEEAIQSGLELHRYIIFKGHSRTNAFPGTGGEIQVTIYAGDDYYAFEREPSGEWTFLHEYKDEEKQFLEHLTFKDALKQVDQIKLPLWSASEFYQNIPTGTQTEESLMTWRSSPIPEMEEFRSLNEIVA